MKSGAAGMGEPLAVCSFLVIGLLVTPPVPSWLDFIFSGEDYDASLLELLD
jgi:hypothetical protein